MEKLTNEEVLHVARLGGLELTSSEIEKFSYQLKTLFDEIDKINEIDVDTDEVLISPSENTCILFDDKGKVMDDPSVLLDNAPKKFDNFVEIRGVFDE